MEKREGKRINLPRSERSSMNTADIQATATQRNTLALFAGLALCACIGTTTAGESISPTFYAGEGSSIAQARTQAIHFHLHAKSSQTEQANTRGGFVGLLAKALTPSQLLRPVHRAGFRIQTQAGDDGLELSAAYRF